MVMQLMYVLVVHVTSNFDEVYLNITYQAHNIIIHNKISLAD